MNLFCSNTLWIFISGNDESRFIGDIRFGLTVLRSKGINDENIRIFIDGEQNLIHARFGEELGSNEVLSISLLEEELLKDAYKNVVLFTTGHGNEFGLDGNNPVSPHELLRIIRTIPDLERGLFAIGQCYAGIFNYLEAKPSKDSNEAEFCILGSAGFSPSLSSPGLTEDQTPKELIDLYGLEKWTANVFLFYFFLWLFEPKDIDGNSKLTVMDAFKYASIKTNRYLNENKKYQSYRSTVQIQEYTELLKTINLSDDEKLAYLQLIDSTLEILHTYQEPFICNSWFAQELRFEAA